MLAVFLLTLASIIRATSMNWIRIRITFSGRMTKFASCDYLADEPTTYRPVSPSLLVLWRTILNLNY